MAKALTIEPKHLNIVQTILDRYLGAGTLAYAFGSRVTGTAKPFSDLDIALEAQDAQPLSLQTMADLENAFDESDLPWRVDIVDINSISEEFRAVVQGQCLPL